MHVVQRLQGNDLIIPLNDYRPYVICLQNQIIWRPRKFLSIHSTMVFLSCFQTGIILDESNFQKRHTQNIILYLDTPVKHRTFRFRLQRKTRVQKYTWNPILIIPCHTFNSMYFTRKTTPTLDNTKLFFNMKRCKRRKPSMFEFDVPFIRTL